MMKTIERFFTGLEAMGLSLLTFILVPHLLSEQYQV